jgi:valyl-tRNA synthetase
LVHKKKQFPLGIPQCGADTLRFGLLNFMHHGKDLNLDVNILITIRQFCNKIWNTFKFVLMNLGDNYQFDASHIQVGKLRLADKWILTELNNSVKQINEFMAEFQYHEATEAF